MQNLSDSDSDPLKRKRLSVSKTFLQDFMTRREIHILDLHQGGGKGVFFLPQHVFANIFMNSYPYVPIFLRA